MTLKSDFATFAIVQRTSIAFLPSFLAFSRSKTPQRLIVFCFGLAFFVLIKGLLMNEHSLLPVAPSADSQLGPVDRPVLSAKVATARRRPGTASVAPEDGIPGETLTQFLRVHRGTGRS